VSAEDAAFVAAFEGGTLPPERFRHAEHVRLAWLMLREHDLPRALARFSAGLRRYAAALGKAERYHETITVAYLLLVHERRRRHERFAGFRRRNPDLFSRSPCILERYYRPQTLASERARAGFVLPDAPASGSSASGGGTPTRARSRAASG
jgi:hypothetical protein